MREDLSEERSALGPRARNLEDFREAGAGVLEEVSEGLRISGLKELLDEPGVLSPGRTSTLPERERARTSRHENRCLMGTLFSRALGGSEEEPREGASPETTELCTERKAARERKL